MCLINIDNTMVISNINHQGRLILLLTNTKGYLDSMLCKQSHCQGTGWSPGSISSTISYGRAEVDLFSKESNQCLLWFTLTSPTALGLEIIAQTWPRLHLNAVYLSSAPVRVPPCKMFAVTEWFSLYTLKWREIWYIWNMMKYDKEKTCRLGGMVPGRRLISQLWGNRDKALLLLNTVFRWQ